MQGETTSNPPRGSLCHGPADPFHPIGEPEILTHSPVGLSVVRQEYEDGHIYEYVVPKGMSIDHDTSYYTVPFFQGHLISACMEGGFSYVSVWIAKNAEAGGSALLEEFKERHVFDHCSPLAPPQTLHESSNLYVIRTRYATGWVYRVVRTLGIPWPNPMEVPCLQTVVGCPVIGVETQGMIYTTKFWITFDRAPA